MHNFRWWLAFSSALLLNVLSFSARGVVNSEVTRVIFNAGDKSTSLALINSPQQPALVQVWTDTGTGSVQSLPCSCVTTGLVARSGRQRIMAATISSMPHPVLADTTQTG